MTIRLAICAIIVASLGTSASATYGNWGDWSDKFCDWHQTENGQNFPDLGDSDRAKKIGDLLKKRYPNLGDKLKDWCDSHSEQQWEEECAWGEHDKEKKGKKKGEKKGRKGKKKGKKNRKHKCDPTTTVTAAPSPTAAVAGLAVMGVMLGRRRNKRG